METFSCEGDIAVMKRAIRSLGKFHRGVEELGFTGLNSAPPPKNTDVLGTSECDLIWK